MADQAGPLAGLTTQDQKLIMGAFKSLRNGFEVSLLSVLLDVCTISGYIVFLYVIDYFGLVALGILCSPPPIYFVVETMVHFRLASLHLSLL